MIRRAITRLSEQVTKMWASLLSVCLHVRFPVCDSLENVYRTTNCHITTRLFLFPPPVHLPSLFYSDRITNLCPWPSSNILNFPSLPLSSLVAALQFLYSQKKGGWGDIHRWISKQWTLSLDRSQQFPLSMLFPQIATPLLASTPSLPLSHHSSPRLHFISFFHSLPTLPSLQTPHCAPFDWKGMVDFDGKEA